MNHFVIGSGTFVSAVKDHIGIVPKGALRFYWAELLYLGGFSYWEATESRLRMKFVDGIGKVRYVKDMDPRL